MGRQQGQLRTINAAREVVLAAGAIGSPQILQLSGIGPGSVLQPLGIEVRHELKGVGENLQDHLQVRCLQYHVQPLTLPKFGQPLDPFPAFTASVANLRPTSRGHVRITSPDPQAHPEIRPNYLSTADDRRVAADAIRITRHIVSRPALARFDPKEFRPGPEVQGDEELAKAAGDIGTTIFHPVGTCKMGSDDTAVVDARLKVRGVAGLRVADASIMPTITSGNTNSPVLMIAEKAAAMILRDARPGPFGPVPAEA
jgi:choline dehydrogenase